VDLNHPPRPYQYCGPLSRSVILRDTGCDPARQSKADALARVAATRGRGASKRNKRWLVLGRRPKDHDSRMGFWRVCLDIREIQVQRHQHAIFRAATLGEHRIAGTRKFLVGDRIRFETRPPKDRCVFCWKILVDFELQALISSGKSTVPSRVNSAAYANAASISGSVSAA
jgi:hypothetical protein